MSDPSRTPWPNHLNAPQIPSWLFLAEKDFFAGYLIGAVSYGIVVALFFQCMGMLLSPINSMKKSTQWMLVAHTVALFSFITIPFGISLDDLSILYINSREFPGSHGIPPGPLGYKDVLVTEATSIFFNVMFPLNQWLADGLLLHRCYVIYTENHWAMAFPYLMYLASVALGIASIVLDSGTRFRTSSATDIATAYYSISLSLTILLTLMIVIRLLIHIGNVRKATGALSGSTSLHTVAATVVTMVVESYALYAVAFLSYVVSRALESWASTLFSAAVGAIQVIAPYLIILRVAKRRALTSESISGSVGSIHFRSQGSTDGDGSFLGGESGDSMEEDGEALGELVTRDGNAIEEVPL